MNDEYDIDRNLDRPSAEEAPVDENEPVYTPVDPVWRRDPEADSVVNARTEPAMPVPEKKKVRKARRGMGPGAILALCLVCAVLASVLGAAGAYLAMRDGESLLGDIVDEVVPTEPPVLTTTPASAGVVDETAAYVYELACRQVVGITTEITYYNIFGQVSAAVAGSGFVIDEDGYILTNYHVVEEAYMGDYEVSVVLYDGTEHIAEIVGFDEDSDLALLKVDANGLAAAELGDSESLTVGQVVYTVGNPLGELSYTMTSGIISARDRAITTETDVAVNMFQIDAAVNEGNSGGPVYNSQGQVIGIVTAKYASAGVEGLGFAIPISDAVYIANQLLEHGYVTDKASLGVTAATVTETIAQYYNMVEGAYVNTIEAGSAAELAGIRVGDIITAVDGAVIADASELTSTVKSYRAGDEAVFTVWRSGETMDLVVIFDEKIPEPEEKEPQQKQEITTQEPGHYEYYGEYSGDIEDLFRQFFGFGF